MSARFRTRFLLAWLGVAVLAVLAILSGSFRRAPSAHPSRPLTASSVVEPVPPPVPAAATLVPGPLTRPDREYRWTHAAFLPKPVPPRAMVRIGPLYTKETIGLQVRVRF